MRLLTVTLCSATLCAQTYSGSVGVQLQARIGAACEIAPLETSTSSPVVDGDKTIVEGSIRLRYWLRTSIRHGEGDISLRLEAPTGSKIAIRCATNGPGLTRIIDDASPDQQIVFLSFGPNQHTSKTGAEAVVHWRMIIPPSSLKQVSPPTTIIRCH